MALDCLFLYKNLPDHLFAQLARADPHKVAPTSLLTKKSRKMVVDWLWDVATNNVSDRVVVHRTVRLMDAYLSQSVVSKAKIQLVAIACFLIASKFDEEKHLTLERCAYYCADFYTPDKVKKMEGSILRRLGWRICFPLALEWLEHWAAPEKAKKRLDTFLADPEIMGLPVWAIAERALSKKNKESL